MPENQSNQTVMNELADWIIHLQDEDSSGAWNDNDTKLFDEIVESLVTNRRKINA